MFQSLSKLVSIANVKTLAEIIAYTSAAVFFIWKLRSGYFIVNVVLSAKVDRVHRDSEADYLAIAAKLSKGGIGSLVLHDARARIRHEQNITDLELLGCERLATWTEMGMPPRTRIDFDKKSSVQPFIFLPPNEEATFSNYAVVPRSAPCIVEVAIGGKRLGRKRMGQWRSSIISLPLADESLPRA